MKRLILMTFVGLMVALAIIGSVSVRSASAESDPLGGCPDSFELHMVMPHEEHGHHHVGTDTDLNGDGWICAKVVGANQTNHVHIDNNVPLP
jgi:hypothetical protein